MRLREVCESYVDEVLPRLSEAERQELEGLAAGCGLPAADLLLTEVLRDGLRLQGREPRLTGALHVRVLPDAAEGALLSDDPDLHLLADEGLLLERKPVGGRKTVLVTWPGSLGGVAGVSDSGLGVLATGLATKQGAQSLDGAPFTLRLRRALEHATGAEDLLTRLEGCTGYRVLAFSSEPLLCLLACVARTVTHAVDLGVVRFLDVAADVPAGRVVFPLTATDPGPATTRFGDRLEPRIQVLATASGTTLSMGYAGCGCATYVPRR